MQTGAPRGRPKKGESLTDALRYLLAKRDKRAELADKVYELAMGGNVAALHLIFERVDGKVPDALKHEGGLTIKVVYADGTDGQAP